MKIPSPLTEPWLISRDGMRLVVDVWAAARAGGEIFGTLEKARAEWKSRQRADADAPVVDGTGGTLRIVDGIGILGVTGTMFRHAGMISDFSGGTSYDALWSGLEVALACADVRAILLRVDSPGGEAAGVGEFGDFIFAARKTKPVWAYVEGMGCSAAYWFASQAEKIVVYRTALVGSIGVRIDVIDTSAADDKAGMRVIEMISSGAPGKRGRPVDDEVLARCQVRLDDLETEFVASVAKGRGCDAAKVYKDFAQGDYVIAAKALDAGMVDELGDFNGTLAALRAEADRRAAAPPLAPAAIASAIATSTAALLAAPRAVAKQVLSADAAARRPSLPPTAPSPPPTARRQPPRKRTTMPKPSAAAEPEKKDEKAEGDEPAMEMVECEHCDGSGKMPDGSKCESCGGTGKVSEKTEADEDEKPKAEEDDKSEKAGAEPDGDEKEAKASLSALAGLKPSASLRQIASALAAKTVPLSAVAADRKKIAELSASVEQLQDKDRAAAASAFVTRAIDLGRTLPEKRQHLEAEYVRAEKAKGGSGPTALEPQLFADRLFTTGRRLTANGHPVGKGNAPSAAVRDADRAVISTVPELESAGAREQYAAKIAEIMKTDKVDYREATARAKATAPDLYATAFGGA